MAVNHERLTQFGEQLAAIIEDPDTPDAFYDHLTTLWVELRNDFVGTMTPTHTATEIRALWPEVIAGIEKGDDDHE
jgi:hypothetical protein